MSDVFWSDTAKESLYTALESVESFFIDRDALELISGQIDQFLSILNAKIELLKENPKLYPKKRDYGFWGEEYRSFSAHWFTVFYFYDEETDIVLIHYIRSSKSNL
jgi:plasmid stabilization system protein ParE